MATFLAVVGSRNFNSYPILEKYINEYIGQLKSEGIIIGGIVSGGCRGCDALAERYSKEYHLQLKVYKPDWSLGRKAGPLRNQKIVDHAQYLIAFPSSDSRGTWDSIRKAKKNKIPHRIIKI